MDIHYSAERETVLFLNKYYYIYGLLEVIALSLGLWI